MGMTASVTIADVSPVMARVPLSALFDQGKGPHVFVVDPATGSLTLTPVDVAGYEANAAVLRNGVSEGANVVTLGVQKLDAGQKVRVVSALGT